MSGTHEHLEHAEHAGHGGHGPDPFTLKVAMTMALIAALLAAVSLLGHRKHNEALQRQGDSNRLLTEAAAYKVESSNSFAYYQSKRARVELAKNSIAMTKIADERDRLLRQELTMLTKNKTGDDPKAPPAAKVRDEEVKGWSDYVKANSNREEDIQLDANGFPVRTTSGEEDNSPGALIVYGKRYKKLAEERAKEAKEQDKAYHHVHHQADGLDWAHLAVELGLVLCTICVLTKKKEFWLAGILAALVGAGLGGWALFLVH